MWVVVRGFRSGGFSLAVFAGGFRSGGFRSDGLGVVFKGYGGGY
jgi:hypothetical protein